MMPEGGTDLAVFDALDTQKEDSVHDDDHLVYELTLMWLKNNLL